MYHNKNNITGLLLAVIGGYYISWHDNKYDNIPRYYNVKSEGNLELLKSRNSGRKFSVGLVLSKMLSIANEWNSSQKRVDFILIEWITDHILMCDPKKKTTCISARVARKFFIFEAISVNKIISKIGNHSNISKLFFVTPNFHGKYFSFFVTSYSEENDSPLNNLACKKSNWSLLPRRDWYFSKVDHIL